MKKISFVIIMFCCAVLLSGCGSKKEESVDEKNISKSVEELIEEAEILDWDKVYNNVLDNGAKSEDYNDKLYIYTAKIKSISEDYCTLGEKNLISVYMDKETLKSLNKGEIITVIGTLTDVSSNTKIKDAKIIDDETIKNNFIIAITETTGKYKNMKYFDYVVDDKTNLVKSYKTTGDESGTHTLKYDENNNLIEHTTESIYGKHIITYTYNKDNTIATESLSDISDGKKEKGNSWNYTYEKDSKDRIVKMTGVNVTSKDKYTMVYTYKYDDNNNVIKETQKSPLSKYVIEYKYDDFNNKIEEISYNDKEPNSKSHTYHTYSIIAKKSK